MSNLIPNYICFKREECNVDNGFGYNQDISEIIPEHLKKWARSEKRLKHCKEGSHCGCSDYTAPNPALIEI